MAKYKHNFSVLLDNENYEGAIGACIGRQSGEYVVARKQRIAVHDGKTLDEKQQFYIGQDENFIKQKGMSQQGKSVFYMAISPSGHRMGISLGHLEVKDQQVVDCIAVYVRTLEGDFELESQRKIDFADACTQFEFSVDDEGELLFFTSDQLFAFRHADEEKTKKQLRRQAAGERVTLDERYRRRSVYRYRNRLDCQPNFGQFSRDQSKFIVTSNENLLFVDMREGDEIDLDEREGIGQIETIAADDAHFIILANKKDGKLGYFLLVMSIDNPHKPARYLMNWQSRIDIGDCAISIVHSPIGEQPQEQAEHGEKQWMIVVSFKCIGINTYNVFLVDLHEGIRCWHESYHLWESKVRGILLENNDFIVLAKDGKKLLSMSQDEHRVLTDRDGVRRKIHSLAGCDYLKVEKSNFIYFSMNDEDNRIINVTQQYHKDL